MIISDVEIINFKNIAEAKLEFSDGVNCLLGLNGMGKSNLLEAIHFLCMARPMSSIPEASLIRHGEEMLMVKGNFVSDSEARHNVSCGIIRGKGKSLRLDGKEYGRIADHIGRFPIVTVTPADSEIVAGSGQERRRLMDMVISQADGAYLSLLMRYNRGLDARNKMLRAGIQDKLLFESIDAGMAEAAAAIHQTRREWIAKLLPDFRRFYTDISGGAEKAGISYQSALNDRSLLDIFKDNFTKDAALGFTSQGIHRDDLTTTLDGYSMRRLGSQGQLKSFCIALKLAIFEYLRLSKGITPLLLLDDIFDKLDSNRVGRIMQTVSSDHGLGQIFITDTNREHLDETIASLTGQSAMFEVNKGQFVRITNQ